MNYLSATQAATRLGKTERTIRRWIEKEGKLKATHPTHGRKDKYLIEESEVERLAKELQLERPAATGDQDAGSLAAQLEQLRKEFEDYRLLSGPDLLAAGPGDIAYIENRIDALEQRIAAIESGLSTAPAQLSATPEPTRTRTPRPTVTTAPIENLEGLRLPDGVVPHYRFAELHGVVPRTFLDHIKKGHVRTIERDKPNRPKEKSYWLTSEQQRGALAFWKGNGTAYHECVMCPHNDQD